MKIEAYAGERTDMELTVQSAGVKFPGKQVAKDLTADGLGDWSSESTTDPRVRRYCFRLYDAFEDSLYWFAEVFTAAGVHIVNVRSLTVPNDDIPSCCIADCDERAAFRLTDGITPGSLEGRPYCFRHGCEIIHPGQ